MAAEPWEERFARQMLVDGIGYDGQRRILATRVTVVGPEPWVSLAFRYLAAAGFQAEAVPAPAGPLRVRVGAAETVLAPASGVGGGMLTAARVVLAALEAALEPGSEEEHGAGPGAGGAGATE
ncbi:conserved protein of unknown function [Candidatus Hydrogenisulfobacillus filiaventi]|uniref:Uncharacterized protein n=1 Tax=Candidatus Hydrogenisulfobacillus filiaventi TaxID=2707344 RepID=A0A6F8ZF63_9FIRM|nr:hypothetical protein [Bacillota bacterium]CAB1128417.1 conserved protein of unknown function [Candidatus Hydrogenisulfobacillus filiaventi]